MKRLGQGLHPFLFALYTVLMVYSHQPGQLFLHSLLRPVLLVLIFSATVYLIGLWRLGNPAKAAMITTVTILLCLMFGHVVRFILRAASFRSSIDLTLMAWLASLSILCYSIARSRGDWSHVNSILNVTSGVLLLVATAQIGLAEIRMRTAAARDLPEPNPVPPDPHLLKESRDVYYVIFDRYGDATTLQNIYGFDNTPTLHYLRSKGFYVAAKSRANYLKTGLSLASSLNGEHLRHLTGIYGENSGDWRPIYRRLESQKVSGYFRALGYHFIQIGSWWDPTMINPHADENPSWDRFSEFSRTLLTQSVFYYLGERAGVSSFDETQSVCKRTLYQFERLMELTRRSDRKFVFAHFLLPHPPNVFTKDGKCLEPMQVRDRNRREGYVSQVQFANTLIERFVESALRTSQTSPIIVIQGDEGPFPERYEKDEVGFDWRGATPEELREKMRILNAYYLPEIDNAAVLYPDVTPVNSFRIILNTYFGTEFDLLPDASYAHVDDRHLYSFFDVTDIVKH
jgi:hypothetical protein